MRPSLKVPSSSRNISPPIPVVRTAVVISGWVVGSLSLREPSATQGRVGKAQVAKMAWAKLAKPRDRQRVHGVSSVPSHNCVERGSMTRFWSAAIDGAEDGGNEATTRAIGQCGKAINE